MASRVLVPRGAPSARRLVAGDAGTRVEGRLQPAAPRDDEDRFRSDRPDQVETEGLDFAPWPGELGQRILAHIGKPAWAAWLAHQTMLINDNRLSPRDPAHRAFLQQELEKFLFGGGAEKPAGYVPPEG